ncbi:MAG TPA: right-handed parallel beta-helix repeat-containing protein [bacterium]
MKKFLLGILISLALVGQAWGADRNIYISSSAAAGGDGSITTPYDAFSDINWTTGGANSIFDWVAAGDDVCVNLSGTFLGVVFSVGTSGVADHPITIQSYGSSITILEYAAYTVFQVSGKSFINITNIQAQKTTTSGGILISNSHDINIYNCITADNETAGIKITAASGGSSYNINVHNNIDYRSQNGIFAAAILGTEIYDININENTCIDNGETGIRCGTNSHDVNIYSNTIKDTGSLNGVDRVWGTGIEAGGYDADTYTYNINIYKNIVSGIIDVDSDGADGLGIRFDQYTKTCTMYNNFVYNCEGNGIADVSKYGFGNIIKSNVILNCNTRSSEWPLQENAGIIINNGTGGTDQGKIYHNTVIGCDRGIYIYASGDVDIKNNIFYDLAAQGILINSTTYDSSLYTEDYNLVNNNASYSVGRIEAYATITNVSAFLGAHSITTDPLITPSGKLQSNSPAIDTGVWITGVNDGGEEDPWGYGVYKIPNIGASQRDPDMPSGLRGFLPIGRR